MGTYDEYPESAMLVGTAQSVWDGSDARMSVEMPANEKLVAALKPFCLEQVETLFITDSDIRHIMKHHARGEEQRGQVDIVPEDFGRIPEVLGEFDTFEHVDTDKLGNRKFELSKEIDDVYYVVTIQRGKRKLQVKTMWKRPGASC